MSCFMAWLIILMRVALLVTGQRHGHHARLHKHHEGERRALVTDVVYVTETVFTTVTADASSAPAMSSLLSSPASAASTTNTLFSTPSNSATSTAVSSLAPPSTSSKAAATNPFQTLQPVANSAIVLNSCDYAVYIWASRDPSCGVEDTKIQRIEPKSTYTETLRICSQGGVSLKVSKSENTTKPMQFEYAVWQRDNTTVSYDISYLDCMNNGHGEKDVSNCAGHDGGIQVVGGGDCKDYYCLAGQWCDQMAYVVAEFDGKDGAPVGGCKVDRGIAFELCAGKRVKG